MPFGAGCMLQALQIATEVNLALAEILLAKFGKAALNTGDEGGFAPPISVPRRRSAVCTRRSTGPATTTAFSYGLDCAATHCYDPATDGYRLAGQALRPRPRDRALPAADRASTDIVTIEDPLHEDDFEGFAELTRRAASRSSATTCSSPTRRGFAKGFEAGSANSLLWKVNQIGTLSEALDAADAGLPQRLHRGRLRALRRDRGHDHRRPVVALNAGQIKTGAPVRGERTAKYNALLLIAEELGAAGVYPTRTGSPTVPVEMSAPPARASPPTGRRWSPAARRRCASWCSASSRPACGRPTRRRRYGPRCHSARAAP